MTTEKMLKELMKGTDKAVAKAQAPMAKVVGKAQEPGEAKEELAVKAARMEAETRGGGGGD